MKRSTRTRGPRTIPTPDLTRVTGGCTFEDLISAFVVPPKPAPPGIESPRDPASGLPTGK